MATTTHPVRLVNFGCTDADRRHAERVVSLLATRFDDAPNAFVVIQAGALWGVDYNAETPGPAYTTPKHMDMVNARQQFAAGYWYAVRGE